MLTIFLIILFVIGFCFIYLLNLEGKYEVRRSRQYPQDIQTVFDKLRDFRSWPEWNPWLQHEPDAKLEYSDNADQEGGFYSWDGKYVGAGKLQHESFDAPHTIQQRLQFTRPFKNICNVRFELEQVNNQTKVSWIMNAEMPFLMRFMVSKMKQMIGQDYDLGLAMLAGALDANAEHPKIEYVGEAQLEAKTCLCKAFSGGLQAMQTAMEQGYPELVQYIESQNLQPTAEPLAVYYKADIKKMYFVCDMAVPVNDQIKAGEYTLKQLGAGKYFQVDVMGSYEFLELAWYAAMSHIFMYKMKYDKKRPSMEVYASDPKSVSHSNEIKTILYIPIK